MLNIGFIYDVLALLLIKYSQCQILYDFFSATICMGD